ncbi:S1 family peptidase [Streptomyces sp. KR80]|uniref:S1 family peptidase n=1 Tax=Streptomyces sp. KR80 TaxID=3457426 RepID=UPI003FCF744B
MALGGLLAVLVAPAHQAGAAPAPLTDPGQAAALAAKLGDDRTGGVYYDDGRPTIAVTNQAAAESVRNAGGRAKIAPHSAAELASTHAELDRLAGIPNTAWGVDPSSNQVSVKIYDGVSAADRARIDRVAAAHHDAVRIEKLSGKLEKSAYEMRGGVGIVSRTASGGRLCSAAFNATNSSGERFLLTAGHCMRGGYYDWYRRNGDIYLGTKTTFDDGGRDYAIIDYRNSNVVAYGMIQYKDGTAGQIEDSRFAYDGESVKRVGAVSQDLVGIVLQPSTTVTYDDGSVYYNMIETSLCNMSGDSGGPLFTGTFALGITSGGNYVEEPCGDTDGQKDRVTYYERVDPVLSDHNLSVY